MLGSSIMIQSEETATWQWPQITAGESRLWFLTSAFTHNSPLPPEIPSLLKTRWDGLNLCLPIWKEFKTVSWWISCLCVVSVCGFWLYHRMHKDKLKNKTKQRQLHFQNWVPINERLKRTELRVRLHQPSVFSFLMSTFPGLALLPVYRLTFSPSLLTFYPLFRISFFIL